MADRDVKTARAMFHRTMQEGVANLTYKKRG
jgi:hypothetical protein